ncbi:MAG TPA: hypothetical protein VK524_33860 [Polyangiaceae bacterium]|nr:hypothetical protein [Polyangiaceae bacterium]
MIAGPCVACGEDGLDFKVASDAGACGASVADGSATRASINETNSANGSRLNSESGASGAESADRDAHGGVGDAAGLGADAQGSTDSSGNPADGLNANGVGTSEEVLFEASPDGYPTRPDEWASWCAEGESRDELCGTSLDEDCDGSVDELAGLGEPCVPTDMREGCGIRAKLFCVPGTTTLRCASAACMGGTASIESGCGNGLVETGEECDPAVEGETINETCTRDCRLPLFTRCVFGGRSSNELCDSETECSSWVGACVTTVGNGKRCPELVVEHEPTVATQAVYPMVETEEKQCWVSCKDSSECPSSLSDCYMGFCVVNF